MHVHETLTLVASTRIRTLFAIIVLQGLALTQAYTALTTKNHRAQVRQDCACSTLPDGSLFYSMSPVRPRASLLMRWTNSVTCAHVMFTKISRLENTCPFGLYSCYRPARQRHCSRAVEAYIRLHAGIKPRKSLYALVQVRRQSRTIYGDIGFLKGSC
jgi:hypothetical protein